MTIVTVGLDRREKKVGTLKVAFWRQTGGNYTNVRGGRVCVRMGGKRVKPSIHQGWFVAVISSIFPSTPQPPKGDPGASLIV
jgi:hypothetical protein